MHTRYLIVGNGVAGINAAKTLVQNDPDGEIAVYAAERYPYYNRWQLPALLAGHKSQPDIQFYPEQWYVEQGIQVHLDSPVQALEPAAKHVILANGQAINYDRLLLATGGHSFIPPIPGADQAGVFALHDLDDALAIRRYAAQARRAAVIGGGLLGLETAHSLKELGLDVTVIEAFPRLLPRQLDAPGSAMFQETFEHLGIQVQTGAITKAIAGDGKVSGVELQNGETIPCELVVVSTGIRGNVELAAQAGLAVKRGIVVNQWLETSQPDIYAAGDCAAFDGPVYGIIPAAIEQAQVAALRMAGVATEPYKGTVPSTTLKVADIDLTCIGQANVEDESCVYVRFEDHDRGIYRKLVLREKKLIGSILLGDKRNVVPITKLIKGAVDLSAYADNLGAGDLDFRALLASAQSPASRYECSICGYVYDPARGDPEANIPAGTSFESLPSDWTCPMCGAGKDMFTKLEE